MEPCGSSCLAPPTASHPITYSGSHLSPRLTPHRFTFLSLTPPPPPPYRIVRSGERDPETVFSCRLAPSSAAEPYVVRGHFLPNRLTPDPNANKVHEATLPADDPLYSALHSVPRPHVQKSTYLTYSNPPV